VSSLADLRVGDLGFGPIGGAVGVGVGLGEVAVAPFDQRMSWRQWWHVRHCGWVVRAATPQWRPDGGAVGAPLFAQAEPGGFQVVSMTEHKFWGRDWAYLRPNYGMRQAATMGQLGFELASSKTPYGFEDYAAIAAHRAGLHVKAVDDFIARTDPKTGLPLRAICSQALDAALTLSGGLEDGHVFDDGRLSQDVTPSELYLRLLELGVEMVFRPGVS
jgi:hypothetical protein